MQLIAGPGVVEKPVEGLEAVAHAEHRTKSAQPVRGQHVAVGQHNFVLAEVVDKSCDHGLVLGVARVVLAATVRGARERSAVDVLGGLGDTGDAAGDVAVIEILRCLGQVGEGHEPAVALTERVPSAVADEGAAQNLSIGDDRVSTEQAQTVGNLACGRG